MPGIIGTHGDLVVVGVDGSLGSSDAADPAAGQAAAAASHVETGTSPTTFPVVVDAAHQRSPRTWTAPPD